MSTKKPYIKWVILLLCMILHGCLIPGIWSNPGYAANIKVQNIYKQDISLIETILAENNFKWAARPVGSKECDWYAKNIIGDQLKHPLVEIGICFNTEDKADPIKYFKILIFNDFKGQDPQLKQEIDSIADILTAELKKLVGEENIKVERKATSPPF